jgi:nucleoid-associated protein YgaU
MTLKRLFWLTLATSLALYVVFAASATPANAAVTAATMADATCYGVTVTATYSGLVGTGSNVVRVHAYKTSLGLPGGELGQADSTAFGGASGTVTVKLSFTSKPVAGTSISLLVSQINPSPVQQVDFGTLTFSCTDPIPGPPIPPGYVQRLLTCDSQLYETPGSNVVPNVVVKAGQTWYVNPTPALDAWNRWWTAIFVGGPRIAYIPTACVGQAWQPTPQPTAPPGYYPGYFLDPYSGTVYVVQRGDTLYSIARRYGVSLMVLANYNRIRNISRIYVGQIIYIP